MVVSRVQEKEYKNAQELSEPLGKSILALQAVRDDTNTLSDLLEQKVVYLEITDTWYVYNGMIWVAAKPLQIINIIERTIIDNMFEFQTKFSASNIRSICDFSNRLTELLPVHADMLMFPRGKAFRNGYFVYKSLTLEKHSPLRGLRSANSIMILTKV